MEELLGTNQTSYSAPLRLPSNASVKVKKTAIGFVSLTSIIRSSGTLTIGRQYIVNNLVVGDDFSNVGFVAPGEIFIATGTTPAVWSNSSAVSEFTEIIDIIANDIDPDLTINAIIYGGFEFISPNGKFKAGYTYPDMNGLDGIEIVSENLITAEEGDGFSFFKIEIY